MSDWWANKLGQQAPQRGGVVLPPVSPPRYPTQQPPHHGQPGQYVQPPQQREVDDPGRKLSLREAISRFSGGESAKVEANIACPRCGSRTGYTEFRGMGGMAAGVMGNRPAPRCYECGFNGKFVQGEASNWSA